jgi:Bacteriophage minor capsid protein
MPLTTDISTYIQANIGTWVSPDNGSNPDGNIFEDFLPDEPDRAVALYELTGTKPQRTLGKGFAWEEPRLRVVNRAPQGTAGEPGTGSWPLAKADARVIWDLLRQINNQLVNGVQYLIVDPAGNPQPSGLDANQRPLYTQEFSVMKYMSD